MNIPFPRVVDARQKLKVMKENKEEKEVEKYFLFVHRHVNKDTFRCSNRTNRNEEE